MSKSSYLYLFILSILNYNPLFAQSPIKEGAQLEKLSTNINSQAHESHPVVSPDGKTLFFSRWKHAQNTGGIKGGADIWVSELDSIGNWSLAKNIGAPLNNITDNYICSILPDENSILLPHVYKADGSSSNDQGVSISHKTSSGWSMPQKLDIDYFTNKSDQGDYFLSSDGKVLIMSIEYFSTQGNEDLHVSFLKEDGKWSQPLNLGPDINTKYHDVSPFLASDGVTLYFSSNGHGGYGSKDIFVTKRLDDTWKKWSKPENLGSTINTAGMETSFVIPASGTHAYLVSSKNSDTHSEIYRVAIPQQAQPEPVILVSGRVFNESNNKPVAAIIKYEVLPDGKSAGITTSDKETGEYRMILPGGKHFLFYATAKGFFGLNENLDAKDLKEYLELKKDLYLIPFEVGRSITLKNIFFEKSSSNILAESFPELDRLVQILIDNSTMEIEIGGHTDNQGAANLNIALSEERVEKVKSYLVSKGLDPLRIKGKGYGGNRPIAANDSEANRKLNRRVEFKILKM